MKQKIKIIAVVILAGSSVYAIRHVLAAATRPSAAAAEAVAQIKPAPAAQFDVMTVGSDLAQNAASLGNSWPGEILSPGNALVQPAREGTIVEWRVKIGDRVSAGQVLARLSAPPAMPELVKMLAEQTESLARARAQFATTEQFSAKNKKQLEALLSVVDETTKASQETLSTGASASFVHAQAALSKASEAAAIMRQNLRTAFSQMLAAHVRMLSGLDRIELFRGGSVSEVYGELDPANREAYERLAIQLGRDLKASDILPVDLISDYFSSFVRLANTTKLGDASGLSELVREDQEKFFDMLAKYRDAESAVAMKETEYKLMFIEKTKEYAEQKREVQEKISENEKMLAMAEAEVNAAKAAYGAVAGSIAGGLSIVAPRAGVVSTILKKVGDFVGPGMPVASINSASRAHSFVRFHIPSNMRRPKIGDMLSVVRPGFAQDMLRVRVTGVGASLDETGAYMADASFLSDTDWPVEASVRVIVPQTADAPLIKLSAVWLDESGLHNVWAVSDAGRVFAKKIRIGRTLGASVEVYDGLKNGERYIVTPTADIHEDLLLDDATIPVEPIVEKDPMRGMAM